MEQLQYDGSIEIFDVPSETKADAIPLPSLQPSFACAMQRSLAHIEDRYDVPMVLDIGCGRKSDIARFFKGSGIRATVHGADLDPYSLENKDVEQVFLCDAADMPFEDGSYNLVFSQFLLEHVQDSMTTVKSIARVMAKGGLVTLLIPNPTSPAAIVTKLTPFSFHLFFKRRIQGFDGVSEDTFPTVFNFKSVSNLKRQMQEAGFKDVEAVFIPEVYLRFRLRPVLGRLAILYTRVITALKLDFLKSSVVMVGTKA